MLAFKHNINFFPKNRKRSQISHGKIIKGKCHAMNIEPIRPLLVSVLLSDLYFRFKVLHFGTGSDSCQSRDIPFVFSPNKVRNMVKLRGPGASPSMSSSILGSGSRPKITRANQNHAGFKKKQWKKVTYQSDHLSFVIDQKLEIEQTVK